MYLIIASLVGLLGILFLIPINITEKKYGKNTALLLIMSIFCFISLVAMFIILSLLLSNF